jgi:hypothetical protein
MEQYIAIIVPLNINAELTEGILLQFMLHLLADTLIMTFTFHPWAKCAQIRSSEYQYSLESKALVAICNGAGIAAHPKSQK